MTPFLPSASPGSGEASRTSSHRRTTRSHPTPRAPRRRQGRESPGHSYGLLPYRNGSKWHILVGTRSESDQTGRGETMADRHPIHTSTASRHRSSVRSHRKRYDVVADRRSGGFWLIDNKLHTSAGHYDDQGGANAARKASEKSARRTGSWNNAAAIATGALVALGVWAVWAFAGHPSGSGIGPFGVCMLLGVLAAALSRLGIWRDWS